MSQAAVTELRGMEMSEGSHDAMISVHCFVTDFMSYVIRLTIREYLWHMSQSMLFGLEMSGVEEASRLLFYGLLGCRNP